MGSSALPTVVPNTGFSQQTAANGDVGQAKPEGVESTSAKSSTGGFGAPQLEGAEVASKAGHGHPGEVRVEGSKSVPKGKADNIVGQVTSVDAASSADSEDEEDHSPRVEEWNPMDSVEVGSRGAKQSSPEGSSRQEAAQTASNADYSPLDSPDGSLRSSASGVCETSFVGTTWPVGYRTVVVGCGVSVSIFLLAFFGPRLRSFSGSGGRQSASARFKDIGARTSEEELGLVQAADNFDDEDML